MSIRHARFLGSTVLATAIAVLLPPIGSAAAQQRTADAPAGVIAAYSLAAPITEARSGLVVRAVLPAGTDCPALDVTLGARPTSVPMHVRHAPVTTKPAFDAITVCSAAVPLEATAASVGGHVVPATMPDRIDRLALLADSGCRIASWQVQDCASPDAWPLARIAQSVADDDPDAIAFNGDFFYREAPCPAGSQELCGSSPPPVTGLPFTDSAYGWIADALLPMAPMLAAAPLIVTRGNHEACYRGGNGFFLLFDPRTGTEATCAPVASAAGLVAAPTLPTGTYAIDLAVRPGRTLRLAIVDSAGGADDQVTAYSAVQRPAYVRAARLSASRSGRESWLVTHRPLYGFVTTDFALPGVPFNPWGSADQTAASYGLLDNFDLVYSSHDHLAQAVQIPGLPGQLLLGNAGTLLDPVNGYPLPVTGPPTGGAQAYPAPSWAWVAVRFGYAIARPNPEGGSWSIDMMNTFGDRFGRCGVKDRQVYCMSNHPD